MAIEKDSQQGLAERFSELVAKRLTIVSTLPEECNKNEKELTVVTRSGLIKPEEIYKKTIFEDEPVSEDVKQHELMEYFGKTRKMQNSPSTYDQLKSKMSN